jgi:hypothetical protein
MRLRPFLILEGLAVSTPEQVMNVPACLQRQRLDYLKALVNVLAD